MQLRFNLSRAMLLFLAVLVSFLLSFNTQASTPKEFLQCTTASKDTWVGEKKIRQVFDANTYAKVFVKISRGNCYEFYAIGHDSSVVEAYYDPVSTDLVRFTRISSSGNVQNYVRPVLAK
jgi:hypothetical protein